MREGKFYEIIVQIILVIPAETQKIQRKKKIK